MALGGSSMQSRTLAQVGCLLTLAVLSAHQESISETATPSLVRQAAWTQARPKRAARNSGRSRDRKKKHHHDKHKGDHDKHKTQSDAPTIAPTTDPVDPESDDSHEVESNYPMQGVIQSPLRQLGVPPPAVPVVATAVTVSAMALWPSLAKAGNAALRTLGAILRQVISGHLRVWAKRGKKLDEEERYFELFGFRLRPMELLSLAATAAVYGLALAYLLVGWELSPQLVLWQILASLSILLVRSLVRFFYERKVGLVTVFRFWPAGGLFCLVSAYLGTMLATGNYELEATGRPDAAKYAARLRLGIVLATLGLAISFFAANWHYPHKVLQMGRLVASGIVLSEVLPVTPMPGLRIFKWHRGVWAVLFGLVVPTYFLINFAF